MCLGRQQGWVSMDTVKQTVLMSSRQYPCQADSTHVMQTVPLVKQTVPLVKQTVPMSSRQCSCQADNITVKQTVPMSSTPCQADSAHVKQTVPMSSSAPVKQTVPMSIRECSCQPDSTHVKQMVPMSSRQYPCQTDNITSIYVKETVPMSCRQYNIYYHYVKQTTHVIYIYNIYASQADFVHVYIYICISSRLYPWTLTLQCMYALTQTTVMFFFQELNALEYSYT